MLKYSFYYRAYFKKQFAQALACCRNFPQLDNAYQLYACYRLDMYRTVANSAIYTGKNWRGGFARAVSLAACGRYGEAREQVETWLNLNRTDEQKANLADCLAPFHPELAHTILQGTAASVTLHAALSLCTGRTDQARDMLQVCLDSGMENQNPENYLYYSNASEVLTTVERLKYLNSFLSAHLVPELCLIEDSKPPSSDNVKLAAPLPQYHGPLVSVLMTAYNSEERIGSAIQSILNQTYRDIELIIVNDASTDSTESIVRGFAEKDSRIKYIRLPRNVGTYVAKNIGMQYAIGEFVTCHDSDDWAHPLKIERQVAPLLANKNLVFTTSHWVRIQDDGVYYARPVHPLMRINPASPLFRRQLVLEHAGAWDPVRTGADSEFLARLKLVFGRKAMKRIVQPLTLGSHRPDSLMTAEDTGYSAAGMSPTRLAYWESWNYWHISELREKRKPALKNFMAKKRSFEAPESIKVAPADIDYCVKNAEGL